MPLPNYSPRSDSFGNWYFGGFQMDSQIEAGYGAATGLSPTQAEWNTFLTAAIGSSNWAISGNAYFYRFDNPWEPLSGVVSGSANYRFAWNTLTDVYLNPNPTGTPNLIIGTSRGGQTYGNFCAFAVANQYGMIFGHLLKGESPGTLAPSGGFAYLSWLKDPVFPTDTNDRIRNCIIGGQSTISSCNTPFTTSRSVVAINTTITCQVSTPGANVTDAVCIDTTVSNLALGYIRNCLVSPTPLTIGQLYRIPPAQDPDGNTEQNIWLCVGSASGWNGSAIVSNSAHRLIRVWSNNIT